MLKMDEECAHICHRWVSAVSSRNLIRLKYLAVGCAVTACRQGEPGPLCPPPTPQSPWGPLCCHGRQGEPGPLCLPGPLCCHGRQGDADVCGVCGHTRAILTYVGSMATHVHHTRATLTCAEGVCVGGGGVSLWTWLAMEVVCSCLK